MSQLSFFLHMDIHTCQACLFTTVSLADRQVPLQTQSFDAAATCLLVCKLCYSYYSSVVKKSHRQIQHSSQAVQRSQATHAQLIDVMRVQHHTHMMRVQHHTHMSKVPPATATAAGSSAIYSSMPLVHTNMIQPEHIDITGRSVEHEHKSLMRLTVPSCAWSYSKVK